MTTPNWKALIAEKVRTGAAEPLAVEITQNHGTERAFTGKYEHHTAEGTYVCIVCDTPLFESSAKFDSGCGWPSFDAAAEETAITEIRDTSYGMIRTEVRCQRCQAHLGHVFPDGPRHTTGLRYCINSASIGFDPKA